MFGRRGSTAPKEDKKKAARDAAAQRIADLEGTAAPAAASSGRSARSSGDPRSPSKSKTPTPEPDDGDQDDERVRVEVQDVVRGRPRCDVEFIPPDRIGRCAVADVRGRSQRRCAHAPPAAAHSRPSSKLAMRLISDGSQP